MITARALTKIIDYYWNPDKTSFSKADVPLDFIEESKKAIKGKYLYRGRQGKQAKLDKFKISLTGMFKYSSREAIDSWTYDMKTAAQHGKNSIILRVRKEEADVIASMDLAIQQLYVVPMAEEYVQDVLERYSSEQEIVISSLSKTFTLNDMIVLFTKEEVEEMQKKGSKSNDFIFHSSDKDVFQLCYADPRKLLIDGKAPFADDRDIIDRLKSLYKKDSVYPPVIDEDVNILDGAHRIIAAKETHLTRVLVLRRVKFPAFL